MQMSYCKLPYQSSLHFLCVWVFRFLKCELTCSTQDCEQCEPAEDDLLEHNVQQCVVGCDGFVADAQGRPAHAA